MPFQVFLISLLLLSNKLFSGDFSVSIDHSDRIVELKKKIKEDQALEPENQALYYKGFLIDEDDVPVSDLTNLGGKIFSLKLSTAGKKQGIRSDRQLHLVVGSRHDFETLLVPMNKTTTFELSSKQFGIVYNTENYVSNNITIRPGE